jgi:hypothetical protein
MVASVFKRSRVERVEARHPQHVAFFKPADDAAQLRAVSPRAACRFPKDLLGSGGAQLLYLRVEALAVGRYSCIAPNHGPILHRIYATGKPF